MAVDDDADDGEVAAALTFVEAVCEDDDGAGAVMFDVEAAATEK